MRHSPPATRSPRPNQTATLVDGAWHSPGAGQGAIRSTYGRGLDGLPAEVTEPLEAALVQRLASEELACAFRVAAHGLLAEIRHVDPGLAERLDGVLAELAELVELAEPASS